MYLFKFQKNNGLKNSKNNKLKRLLSVLIAFQLSFKYIFDFLIKLSRADLKIQQYIAFKYFWVKSFFPKTSIGKSQILQYHSLPQYLLYIHLKDKLNRLPGCKEIANQNYFLKSIMLPSNLYLNKFISSANSLIVRKPFFCLSQKFQ
jgi:hypothetical protein